MSRKIILDCDPGIADAVALTVALFDPRLDVLAVTATAGSVDADQATTNAMAIVHELDPPRYPQFGRAISPDDAAVIDDSDLNGPDGLGGCHFPNVSRQNNHTSDKVMADCLRRFPGEITIVCLGPMTNLARLVRRDPTCVALIDKVVIRGGAVASPGDATAISEMNCFFDAAAAKSVFGSATTKSLIPLDVTDQITFGVDLIEKLPSTATRAGKLLRRLLPYIFRANHQRRGREVIPLADAVAVAAVLEADLFTWDEMAGDVEVAGTLTRGMTVFDRRLRPEWNVNMEVALQASPTEVRDVIVRGLRYAGQKTMS
ncbi:MAG: nucleoside hydrolase [Planctomycetota bacterium]